MSRHTPPTRAPIVLLLAHSAVVGMPATASAQVSEASPVRATVQNLGTVLAVSPLQPGAREAGGDLNVHGTVTVRQNGAHGLQVRLSEPHDPQGRPAASDVFARVGDALILLDTEAWVTLAAGPGTPAMTHAVAYLVVWARNAPRRPADAVNVPLEYRVIPLDSDDTR